jgi:hypothetical protein
MQGLCASMTAAIRLTRSGRETAGQRETVPFKPGKSSFLRKMMQVLVSRHAQRC